MDLFLTSALLGLAAATLHVIRTKPKDVFLEELRVLEAVKKDTESTRTGSRGREEVERWVGDVDRFLGGEVRAFENSRVFTVPVLCHLYCLWLDLDNRIQRLKSRGREIQRGIRHESNPSPPPTLSCSSESEPGRNECQAEVEIEEIQTEKSYGDGVKLEPFMPKRSNGAGGKKAMNSERRYLERLLENFKAIFVYKYPL